MNRENIKVTFLSYRIIEDTGVSISVVFDDMVDKPGEDVCVAVKNTIMAYSGHFISHGLNRRYPIDENCWFYINGDWYTFAEETYNAIKGGVDEIELIKCAPHSGFKIYEDRIKLEIGEITHDEYRSDLLDDPV